MIKCPKCGSINIAIERRPDGWCYCGDCSYSWQRGRKEPELTVAEKLLWLAENCADLVINNSDKEMVCSLPNCEGYEEITFYYDEPEKGSHKNLREAINDAYLLAKEQEK